MGNGEDFEDYVTGKPKVNIETFFAGYLFQRFVRFGQGFKIIRIFPEQIRLP
jgi:hypothetical protein